MIPDIELRFRKAVSGDSGAAWSILRSAKERMRLEGRTQWQGDYPSSDSVDNDIRKGYGYVLEAFPSGNEALGQASGMACHSCPASGPDIFPYPARGTVAAYGAVVFDGEPAYDALEGRWLSVQPYVAVHRLAVAPGFAGKGLAQRFLEETASLAASAGIRSFKVDTNHDNVQMLHVLDKLGFAFCGMVRYESPRLAFEKLIG